MHRRTARGNRIGLALTGLLLALAGAALLAAHQGRYAGLSRRDVLYPRTAQRFVHEHGSWLWPALAAAAVVVGLLFLRWLLVQARIDRLRRLVVDDEPAGAEGETAGRTRVLAPALTDVVEDDIAALPGVRRVSAVLSGRGDAPQLWLRVATDADADVARIRRDITDRVLPDARTCLDRPDLPAYLRFTVTTRTDAGRGSR